ncbi:MAG: glycosyltransferase family 39 protein [Chloroflexi bacterium]|nr:glycosyltransferase family 39 protein [Chloroflexota bacterium]
MISRPRIIELTALTLILLLAAYLRLANVAVNPAWYTDEGTHLDIVRHLLQGQVQYLAVNQSWLLFSRLPLFEFLLSGAALSGGVNMLTLRTVTGLLGVITVAVLYLTVRRMTRDIWLALLAALLLAICPSAVLYSRFGFSYNLLAPLVLTALLGLVDYSGSRSKRWLVVSALSIGLGTLSDLWMFVMLAPFVLIVLIRNWRDALWSVPLALLPLGSYAMIMLATAPQAFLFDLRFVLSRVNQLSGEQQAATLWQNVTTLAAQDVWLIVGVIGLLLLRPPRLRWIALAFFAIPIVLLGRTTALYSLSFYYLIPLFPFIALGVASLVRYGTACLTSRFGPQSAVALSVLTAALLLLSTFRLVEQVRDGFRTDIDGFLLDPMATQEAAAFVNQRTASSDLVIASPILAWMLHARVADIQMPLAQRGQATPHLPANVPRERWAFEPNVELARFVIVDNLWRNWAVPNMPGVADLLQEIATWPIVLRLGEVMVYQNPED